MIDRRAFLKLSMLLAAGAVAPYPMLELAEQKPFDIELDLEILAAGIERCSPLILDNMGLMVNMEEIAPFDVFSESERRERVFNHVVSELDLSAQDRLALIDKLS